MHNVFTRPTRSHLPPADPVEPRGVVDPVAAFTEIAARHGLIRPGDKLDQNIVDLMTDVVQLCAAIGDGYGDPDAGGNAGEHIRAVYYPH